MQATYTRLPSGEWGIRVPDVDATPGATIRVQRANGDWSEQTIGQVLRTANGWSVATISDATQATTDNRPPAGGAGMRPGGADRAPLDLETWVIPDAPAAPVNVLPTLATPTLDIGDGPTVERIGDGRSIMGGPGGAFQQVEATGTGRVTVGECLALATPPLGFKLKAEPVFFNGKPDPDDALAIVNDSPDHPSFGKRYGGFVTPGYLAVAKSDKPDTWARNGYGDLLQDSKDRPLAVVQQDEVYAPLQPLLDRGFTPHKVVSLQGGGRSAVLLRGPSDVDGLRLQVNDRSINALLAITSGIGGLQGISASMILTDPVCWNTFLQMVSEAKSFGITMKHSGSTRAKLEGLAAVAIHDLTTSAAAAREKMHEYAQMDLTASQRKAAIRWLAAGNTATVKGAREIIEMSDRDVSGVQRNRRERLWAYSEDKRATSHYRNAMDIFNVATYAQQMETIQTPAGRAAGLTFGSDDLVAATVLPTGRTWETQARVFVQTIAPMFA